MASIAVSVVIPARNEEARIERAIRSVAAQPQAKEIIVADDRSEDGTAAILEGLQAEIPRLKVLRLDGPPEGWVGNTHACAAGAAEATGDWLLFTGAATEHTPGGLGRALDEAERQNSDLVSLSPSQVTVSWWEKSVIPYVCVELSRRYRFDKVNDPQSPAAAADGQYLLIRRSPYDACGGHAAVRGEILEDVALAKRVKSRGGRLLFLPGAGYASTRMYTDFAAMWEGWRKNLYPLLDASPAGTLAAFARCWLLDVAAPLVALLAAILAVAAAQVSYLAAALVLAAVFLARRLAYRRALGRLGFSPQLANHQVTGAALFVGALLDSMAAYRWAGSVRWKGRVYSTRRPAAGKGSL